MARIEIRDWNLKKVAKFWDCVLKNSPKIYSLLSLQIDWYHTLSVAGELLARVKLLRNDFSNLKQQNPRDSAPFTKTHAHSTGAPNETN